MKDDIKLPPLHYDELPEVDDAIPAMHAYAIKAIKADRQRRSDLEGWKLAPLNTDWDMEMAGIKELIQCGEGELECIDGNLLDSYGSEVSEIFCAMLKAAPKFGEKHDN